ncbi:MAG: hypothetical protein ACXAC5_01120 [Promethearchaeota archaeon]|jgi:hypothetical protein
MAQNKNRKTASTASTATRKKKAQGMKVTSRIVDVRRHTKGYVAGGKNYTIPQMCRLAMSGRVRGVQVVGDHIQALPGQKRLTDLPMKIMK